MLYKCNKCISSRADGEISCSVAIRPRWSLLPWRKKTPVDSSSWDGRFRPFVILSPNSSTSGRLDPYVGVLTKMKKNSYWNLWNRDKLFQLQCSLWSTGLILQFNPLSITPFFNTSLPKIKWLLLNRFDYRHNSGLFWKVTLGGIVFQNYSKYYGKQKCRRSNTVEVEAFFLTENIFCIWVDTDARSWVWWA